jgi:phosphoglycerate kinase
MIKIRTLDQLPLVSGSRVFYRVDYNVPLDGSEISDATRIEETLPTLRILRDRGAAIVIASHLGRPKGERKEKYSLKPVREKLAQLAGVNVQWADDAADADTQDLRAGEILLLENLRFHAGEEANNSAFAERLRRLGD